MAVIHRTTLTPTKLELLTSWLPTRPWYEGEGRPELLKGGGFRLDDPKGEVGIDFMVVTDVSGDRPVSYHVPLTYRGAPLEDTAHALIGTAEHGVLGPRWVYDGTHDPVLVAQLHALLHGDAEPQHQSVSDTPDPSVVASLTGAPVPGPVRLTGVADGPHATDIVVDGDGGGRLTLRFTRVMRPGEADAGRTRGHVTAGWRLHDETEARGVYVVVLDAPR
ncbi:1,4-alpha-glucan branching protein [Microbispora hainanensis]|jgi:hypothetical protein|uniref:1,4-alpha-glucan branching protein n=1 Tax=Microbispora hainanensis TaxID=568844 RepID=A0ABZ1SW10_9ACTN|nr:MULTISPECIES: 1,4-alpha-glucan branching protein [Microbispora]NJP27258.1 1,4-alpha-glucan branching protein [Microbispora sp. CL1-1]TQS11310.1 1,4-alpha-glucan branching protein [Microbispora sp. SCL1-1]